MTISLGIESGKCPKCGEDSLDSLSGQDKYTWACWECGLTIKREPGKKDMLQVGEYHNFEPFRKYFPRHDKWRRTLAYHLRKH